MSNPLKLKKLGLCLGNQQTFLTEITHSPESIEVTNLIDLDLVHPFNFNTINNEEILEGIGNILKESLSFDKKSNVELSISIDYSMAIIKHVPVDNSLKSNELENHIQWELQQHIISPVEEYDSDFQKLPKIPNNKYPSIITIAVKKKIIDAVKYISKIANLKLDLIDINIFSAINALEVNYKIKPTEKTALIEIGKNRLIFIILEGTNFLGFHPAHLVSHLSPDEEIPTEKIFDEISKNLRFLISDYETGDDKKEFDRIYLYKTNKNINLNDILSKDTENKFEILNPLKNLKISSELKEKMDPLSDYSEHTVSVGLVIRK
jgi:Tfp pilus assembly PilM family ATPase